MTEERDYFGNKSNERVYFNLIASISFTNKIEKLEQNDLKIALYITLESAATTLRLRIWSYSLGEYLYVTVRDGLTLHHKTYSTIQDETTFWNEKAIS